MTVLIKAEVVAVEGDLENGIEEVTEGEREGEAIVEEGYGENVETDKVVVEEDEGGKDKLEGIAVGTVDEGVGEYISNNGVVEGVKDGNSDGMDGR